MHIMMEYLANKPLLAAGISKDNAQGLKIVQKMNSWPRSEASRATVKF